MYKIQKYGNKIRTVGATMAITALSAVSVFASDTDVSTALSGAMTEFATGLKPVIAAVAVAAVGILVIKLTWTKGIDLFKSFTNKAG